MPLVRQPSGRRQVLHRHLPELEDRIHPSRYGEAGHEVHQRPTGSAMTVQFELDGHPFTALNGGSHFKVNEAISFQVSCETQKEVDHYWDKLSEGGDPKAQQRGWLRDKYGLS